MIIHSNFAWFSDHSGGEVIHHYHITQHFSFMVLWNRLTFVDTHFKSFVFKY